MKDATSSPPRLVEGKYVLLAVFGLGIAAAAGGWWYQHGLQRRPLELWGHEAAQLILNASNVELCRVLPTSEISPSTVIEVNAVAYELHNCQDAVGMRGMLHLRHSLLSDYSFDWIAPATGKHDWRYALRFRDGDKTATLFISVDFRYVLLLETGVKACVQPIAHGIMDVISDGAGHIGMSRVK